jgi:chromosome segregation ATPase
MESEAKPDAPPAGTPWLEALERRVHEAVAEMARLRQENRRLERELAKLRKKGGEAGGAAASWQREREEVRASVERLASHLEGLLAGEEPPPSGGTPAGR